MEASATPVLAIPEIRDYERINAELARLLDAGHARVRLTGSAGERLLLAGLRGAWSAVVEVEGRAGPELAAGLDAPSLVVLCREAADGAGRGLRAGSLMIAATAGDCTAFRQEGGVISVASTGHRAGLEMRGGTLLITREAGRLVGDRQSGGRIFLGSQNVGEHPGHARRGGHILALPDGPSSLPAATKEDHEQLMRTIRPLEAVRRSAN